MTIYTALFRTAAAYAAHAFEADAPEQALQMARTFFEDHAEDLMFTAYDGRMSLEEIEICEEDTTTTIVWQSDDLRVHLAAPEMLQALEMATNFMGDDLSGDPTETRVYETLRAVIAKATGP
jgi:hypothetical protein